MARIAGTKDTINTMIHASDSEDTDGDETPAFEVDVDQHSCV